MIIRWKHILVTIAAMASAGILVGWMGLIGVGASGGHWAITDWFLHWVMRNSVRTAALSLEAPELDNAAYLPFAAGHYETGCAICHGSPAQPRSDAVLAMLPVPPDLKATASTWSDEQLFQIIQHGIKFTGMPAWPAQTRPDEVWGMVAFVRKLPEMTADEYYRLSGLHLPPMEGEVSPLPITCESCHSERKLHASSLVPSLAGQSEAYLLESLRAYSEGQRPSGVMGVAVGTLPDEALPSLARYYAGQSRLKRSATTPAAVLEAGRLLAENGRADKKIPACLSCHEKPGANPVYPFIAGQGRAYLERQLRLFKAGNRGGTRYSHLMTKVARGLSEDDIVAVSAYFAQRQK